ncbi:hypothetical protein AMK16_06665 [Streptomyces sp. CB00455]|uniref:hypothetical protein n=1 Tax=Streptomyces sp. CB00455 TaxID=1703927 RepID=UPI00093D3D4D|nr:hypothetical protein [Streptomyces sp. CB00455]OKK22737.1 hypothetical protein AMK16_06665 [Streptomyces sp. CB00455]
MRPKARAGKGKSPVIVVAGEGKNDRQVLRHLIAAVHPGAKIVNVNKKTALSQADTSLSPRVAELRRLSQAASVGAELAGVVVHVDLDAVDDAKYLRVRERISAELRKEFGCPSALALAAFEMEAWLMQFPSAFTKVNSRWILKARYKGCDLSRVDTPKEKLRDHGWNPPYDESFAPDIMEHVFASKDGHMEPDGKNRSYEEFMAELRSW